MTALTYRRRTPLLLVTYRLRRPAEVNTAATDHVLQQRLLSYGTVFHAMRNTFLVSVEDRPAAAATPAQLLADLYGDRQRYDRTDQIIAVDLRTGRFAPQPPPGTFPAHARWMRGAPNGLLLIQQLGRPNMDAILRRLYPGTGAVLHLMPSTWIVDTPMPASVVVKEIGGRRRLSAGGFERLMVTELDRAEHALAPAGFEEAVREAARHFTSPRLVTYSFRRPPGGAKYLRGLGSWWHRDMEQVWILATDLAPHDLAARLIQRRFVDRKQDRLLIVDFGRPGSRIEYRADRNPLPADWF